MESRVPGPIVYQLEIYNLRSKENGAKGKNECMKWRLFYEQTFICKTKSRSTAGESCMPKYPPCFKKKATKCALFQAIFKEFGRFQGGYVSCEKYKLFLS